MKSKDQSGSEDISTEERMYALPYSKMFEYKIVNIFLSISLNICLGCSKESSHQDDSFEYPQNMFWPRNKKIIF